MDKKEFIRRFVGEEKAEVYEKKFDKIESGKISWNWCAFLVTPCWLLYRRLYAWFFAFMGVSFAITTVLSAFGDSNGLNTIDSLISLVLTITAGLFGDRIYKRKIDKAWGEVLNTSSEENRTNAALASIKSNGGTKLIPMFIYLGAVALLIILLFVALSLPMV